MHDQRRFWGRRGIHYHQFLKAGENTLNLKICHLLIGNLDENGGYDADVYLDRYIEIMTTPGNHRDTYVEEYHRHFLTIMPVVTSPATAESSRSISAGLSV